MGENNSTANDSSLLVTMHLLEKKNKRRYLSKNECVKWIKVNVFFFFFIKQHEFLIGNGLFVFFLG